MTGVLYQAPLDGSLAPTALDQRTGLQVDELVVTGTHVVYVARLSLSNSAFRGLYSVPRDASLAPLLLNGPAVGSTGAWALALAPNDRVLFRNAFTPFDFELYAVPADGSLARYRISAPMSNGRQMIAYALSPDGQRVAYLADQRTNGAFELLATTVTGTAPPVPYRPEFRLR